MAKCKLCNKKIRFSRKCPAINEIICSTCCGSKKVSQIQCTDDCKYFIEGQIKENKKQIMQLVKESFNNEFEDIYRNEEIVQFTAPFELFIFDNYYSNIDVTDEFISN